MNNTIIDIVHFVHFRFNFRGVYSAVLFTHTLRYIDAYEYGKQFKETRAQEYFKTTRACAVSFCCYTALFFFFLFNFFQFSFDKKALSNSIFIFFQINLIHNNTHSAKRMYFKKAFIMCSVTTSIKM